MTTTFKTLQDIDDFIDYIDECRWFAKHIQIIEIDSDKLVFPLVGCDRKYMINDKGQIINLSFQ